MSLVVSNPSEGDEDILLASKILAERGKAVIAAALA